MTKRRNPFPGVTTKPDRHGKLRHRLRRSIAGRKIDCYLPGPYASEEFRVAYHAAHQNSVVSRLKADPRTVGYLIESYLATKEFQALKDSTRKGKRLRLDRIKTGIGSGRIADVRPHHVEKLMDKMGGPAAANRLRKDLSQLFTHAARRLGYQGSNPAKLALPRKGRRGGHHTWTEIEIDAYRLKHKSGTLARLAMELMLNTGAARIDVVKLGRGNVRGKAIAYVRQKTEGQAETEIEVVVPILPELAVELAQLPHDAFLFLTHEKGRPYKVETFGNLFRGWCVDAGVPGRAHGLRKAGARRLAEVGATVSEIMAVLGHATPAEAIRYSDAASRRGLAASGIARLRTKNDQKLSNPPDRLDISAKEGKQNQ